MEYIPNDPPYDSPNSPSYDSPMKHNPGDPPTSIEDHHCSSFLASYFDFASEDSVEKYDDGRDNAEIDFCVDIPKHLENLTDFD